MMPMVRSHGKVGRFLRISLFGLFAAQTCIAVALGWICQRAEQQRQAVNWILSQGGEIRYEHYLKLKTGVCYTTGSEEDKAQRAACSPENGWLANAIGKHYVHHVEEVLFQKSKLEGDVRSLKYAHGAKKLMFWECNLTADVLASIGDCNNAETIYISDCRWNQTALGHLARLPKLKHLYLQNMPLDNEGLEHLGKCNGLESLDLTYCKFPATDFSKLRPLTKLTYCGLCFTSVGDKQLYVVADWRNLMRLELGENVTDAGLAELKKLKNLDTLVFMKSVVTDAGIVQLVGLPKLHSLHMSQCQLSDELISRLSKEDPKWVISYVR